MQKPVLFSDIGKKWVQSPFIAERKLESEQYEHLPNITYNPLNLKEYRNRKQEIRRAM